MSRSQAVRAEALKLDGFRCQICGYDGRDEQFRPWVVPHHGVAEGGRKLGMGGSTEQDNVENTITLCSGLGALGLPPNRKDFLGPNEGSCHTMVEAGKWVIAKWQRERFFRHDTNVVTGDPVIGCCTDAGLEVFDVERRKIPHEHLWFYRRHDAEEGEQILTQLSSFAMLDSTIAERVFRLGQVVDVTDPASRTLRECLASNGLDTRRLMGAANLWEKSFDGLEWPEGMTVSDYRKMRRDAGHGSKREWFYSMTPHPSHRRKLKKRGWLTVKRQTVIRIRTAYEAELRDLMEKGDELEKTGKFVYGNRAEGGKLFKPGGSVEVDVVHFVPQEA